MSGWTVEIRDINDDLKLRLSYPTRAKGKSVKSDILSAPQLYKVKLLDERMKV